VPSLRGIHAALRLGVRHSHLTMSTLEASAGRRDTMLFFLGGLALLFGGYVVSAVTRPPNPCIIEPIRNHFEIGALLLSFGACIASPFATTKPITRKLLLSAAAFAVWTLSLAILIVLDTWLFGLTVC